jgi:hypothetical protein
MNDSNEWYVALLELAVEFQRRAQKLGRFRGTLHRAICCGTGTNRMGRHSAIAFARWASPRSSLPPAIALAEPLRRAINRFDPP